MNTNSFHHAFRVDQSICVGCTHCMRVCPTQAIRVRNGKAQVMPERCIDCGECYRVCPVHAFKINQDDLSAIRQYTITVALLPAVMTGQFPDEISTDQIYQAIHSLGFTHVFEVEQSVDFLKEQIQTYTQQHDNKPLISSFCPAVVRLIQVRFPSLTGHIIRIKAPHDLTAELVKNELKAKGFNEQEIGIFYITPCAAKIAAVKSPVGEDKSVINGVINMDSFYDRIMAQIKKGIARNPAIQRTHLTPAAITWSLTNGEVQHARGRALAIDGIRNVNDFLEKIENEEITDVDFLELRACDESCAGGILCHANRFLTAERLRSRAAASAKEDIEYGLTGKNNPEATLFLQTKMTTGPIDPRPIKLDDDLPNALKKLERIRELMCFLPGFDCGACGAPDCHALAEDIVQKRSNISDCIFMQHTSLINRDHAQRIIYKIWGEEALNKDCSKKGAKNEGS